MIRKFLASLGARRERQKSKQFRLLSRAIQLEETFDPRLARVTMLTGSAVVLMVLVWSGFAQLNELARTSGTIEPVGNVRIVQHLDGGIVKQIHVAEGQRVARGDLLVSLAGGNLQNDLTRAKRRLRQLRIDERRYRAYLKGENPDFSSFGGAGDVDIADALATHQSQVSAQLDRVRVARLQLEQNQRDLVALTARSKTLETRLADVSEIYENRKVLFAKGLITRPRLLQSKQDTDRIRGEIQVLHQRIAASKKASSEREARIDSLRTENRAINYANLNSVLVLVGETEELVDKLEEQVSRLQIHAPVGGIVKGLELSEPGEIIQSAATIVKIVPVNEQLVARVKISPRDIGHLQVGLPVQVKVSAYDFGRYGAIEGRLAKMSAATFKGDGGAHYYSGEVVLGRDFVGNDPALRPIAPGMIVSADIVTGSKSVLQYLLQPVYSSLSVAFSER